MTPRQLIIKAIQAEHDDTCCDYSCKCHERDWDTELEMFVSQTCLDLADEIIADIEEAAVRRYRGLDD